MTPGDRPAIFHPRIAPSPPRSPVPFPPPIPPDARAAAGRVRPAATLAALTLAGAAAAACAPAARAMIRSAERQERAASTGACRDEMRAARERWGEPAESRSEESREVALAGPRDYRVTWIYPAAGDRRARVVEFRWRDHERRCAVAHPRVPQH